MPLNELNYFACANSGTGFINNYYSCFNSAEHIYIIKGGSGTGKSYFMKKAAKKALSLGMNIEYYRCSSDPGSLDGLMINDISVGILDGTAPHTMDPIYPGAREEIINMGDFWDTETLKRNKNDIRRLCTEKNMLFGSVYNHLAIAYQAEITRKKILLKCFDLSTISAAAGKTASNIMSDNKNTVTNRFTQGITMNGLIKFDNFSKYADLIYNIEDKYEAAYLFFAELNAKLTNSRMVCTATLCPSDICSVYTTDSKILFDINNEKADRTIHMQRFINQAEYDREKGLIEALRSCKENMLENVYAIFKRIKKAHFELEDIYCSAMDFEAKEKHEDAILNKIFG